MDFDWDDGNRDKAQKHGLTIGEIEGFFRLRPCVRRTRSIRRPSSATSLSA